MLIFVCSLKECILAGRHPHLSVLVLGVSFPFFGRCPLWQHSCRAPFFPCSQILFTHFSKRNNLHPLGVWISQELETFRLDLQDQARLSASHQPTICPNRLFSQTWDWLVSLEGTLPDCWEGWHFTMLSRISRDRRWGEGPVTQQDSTKKLTPCLFCGLALKTRQITEFLSFLCFCSVLFHSSSWE